jgi:hypothetical protein
MTEAQAVGHGRPAGGRFFPRWPGYPRMTEDQGVGVGVGAGVDAVAVAVAEREEWAAPGEDEIRCESSPAGEGVQSADLQLPNLCRAGGGAGSC